MALSLPDLFITHTVMERAPLLDNTESFMNHLKKAFLYVCAHNI